MATTSFTKKIPKPENGFTLKVALTYEGNATTNKTNISSIKGYVKRNDSSYYPSNTSRGAQLKIEKLNSSGSWERVDTLENNKSYSISSDSYYTWISGTDIDVEHLEDGTQKIRVTFSVDGNVAGGLENWYPVGSVSQIITLDELHKAPDGIEFSITETNEKLIAAGINNDVFVKNLSIKQFDFTSVNLYDDAIVSKYTIFNRINPYSSDSNRVVVNFKDVEMLSDLETGNYVPLAARVIDSLGVGAVTDPVNYSYIPYSKPTLIDSMVTVKRNGQTSGKVLLSIVGNFFEGLIGNINQLNGYKPSVFYRFWKNGSSESEEWIEIGTENIETINGTIAISNLEIGNEDQTAANYFDYEQSYKVDVKIVDNFESYSLVAYKSIPVGKALWTEYKDRVDFEKITIQGKELNSTDVQLDGESIVTAGVANISKTVSMSVSTKVLKSGFSTTATTVDFTGYIGIYIRFLPASGSAYVPAFIPANLITTTATSYQGADESNWISVSLQKSGNNIIILGKGRSATSGNYAVYGVKLNGTIEAL